jgi:hypothetical protein
MDLFQQVLLGVWKIGFCGQQHHWPAVKETIVWVETENAGLVPTEVKNKIRTVHQNQFPVSMATF